MSDTDCQWQIPPTDVRLGENEVHVWRVVLERSAQEMERLQDVLVDEEIERTRKFYFEKDRRSWIVAHTALRLLLGQYLHVHPLSLHFTANAYGKPFIAYPAAGRHLSFNLSHSGNLALCAFAYNRHLGVDVEYRRPGSSI